MQRYLIPAIVRLAVVLTAIAVILTGLWSWGARNNHVPCISDCGETFIAQLYARNFRLFGLDFGLVEDHATSPSREAHPYHYTHNVNLGGLFYVALEAAGVQSFSAKQFFVLLVFGMGLLYVYLATAGLTKSALIGFCTLAVACLDFGFFLGFSLHALRAWTWLALFGLILHVGKYAGLSDTRSRVVHGSAILVFSAVAFGIGYEFWIIAVCIAIAVHYCFSEVPGWSWLHMRQLAVLLALMLVPFLARQIHIAAVLGPDYWSRDFQYTFAAKIPFASGLLHLPSPEEVEGFYARHNVMRPPTAPVASMGEFKHSLVQLRDAFVNVVLPTAGVLTALITTLLSIAASIYCVFYKVSLRRGPRRESVDFPRDIDGSARVLAGLAIGLAVGTLIMVKMVVPFYFALGMPLIGALMVMAKGIALGLVLRKMKPAGGRPLGVAIAALMAMVLIVDHGIVQAENVRAAKPMDTSWIPIVASRPQNTFAVSFIAPAAAGFTSNWAVGIRTGREWEMFADIAAGKNPFKREDLFWFGERDAEKTGWKYLRPDFWLYFRMDGRTLFSAEPQCRQDYLMRGFAWISRSIDTGKPIQSSWIQPSSASPGSKVIVGAKVRWDVQIKQIAVTLDGKHFERATFNCISNIALVEVPVPGNASQGPHTINADIALGSSPALTTVALGTLEVDSTIRSTSLQPAVPRPQPSVSDVLARYPNLSLEAHRTDLEAWQGYLLIDLRQLNAGQ